MLAPRHAQVGVSSDQRSMFFVVNVGLGLRAEGLGNRVEGTSFRV